MSPIDVYQKNEMSVAGQDDLLLKTFEELISKLNMAKIAMEENLIKEKVELLDKIILALEILRQSLDFGKGGDIAKNLDAIYAFCIDELIKANVTNAIEHIDNVMEVLLPIAEGFGEIVKKKSESAV